MKKFLNLLLLCIAVIGFGGEVTAADTDYTPELFITTHINQGDPACPFPQFLEYKGGGKSLAKYNAEGVTHADMEKAMREAYQIMMHRCRYSDLSHDGVQYITFNSDDVPGNYGTFVSEGDGYALLAAAIFADQNTFTGLYMWIHDVRFAGVERFIDGKSRGTDADNYAGPYMAAWKDKTFDATYGTDSHSASDGDMDIAMGMLIAYKQWGEWLKYDGRVVKDYNGKPISLKYHAQRVIGALVDTVPQHDKGNGVLSGYITGIVGADGYQKRGNSWGDLTTWRIDNSTYEDCIAKYPNINGDIPNSGPYLFSIWGGNYIDYDGPSYFDEFYRWLKDGDGVDDNNKDRAEWEMHQFRRAYASGNWLNAQAYAQGYYASIGRVSMSNHAGPPTFDVYVDGEDFRYAWRHLIDYLWHGTAQCSWDPVTHQVVEGATDDSERLMAIRHCDLLREPSNKGKTICSAMGASPDPGQPYWKGVSQIPQQYRYDGGITSVYHTNYTPGSSAAAPVIAEDLELTADIYRQCEILWDDCSGLAKFSNPDQRYIGSTPKYFHGWFRTLGMLICSGNLLAPEDMKPTANVKVYMSVDKTYAYVGDDVTYGVQYRNYGTLDATGTKITTKLDPNYTFVSATKGGKYNASDHSITWNIGSIPGFKSDKLAATMDSVFFTVNVAGTLNPRICLTSTISGSNFDDWTSNEYPNHATYTMERNCVDILASRSLYIKKKANRTKLNPKDVVTFTVEFGNKSEGEDSWMNGGRDHVRISYANYVPDPCYQFYMDYRFWNDSYEAYINMHNYRVSYYMYDAAAKGLVSTDNPTGWTFVVDNVNDLDKYGYNPEEGPISFSYQKVPQGEDEYGKWNQRLMIRFGETLMAPSTHVYDKLDSQYLLHKGVYGPGFIRARLASNPASQLQDRVKDDWSYSEDLKVKTIDAQAETFALITPCWANYDNPGYELGETDYSRHVCGIGPQALTMKPFSRVLVEEFDGYTWRRIQGTGPLPGREAYNVVVWDTIPYELEWVGWKDSTALKDDNGNKIKATYTPAADPKGQNFTGIVKWTIPTMLVGEEDKLVYLAKARDLGCPDVDDVEYKNVAWIKSETDSPDSSQVDLLTTCSELPPVIEEQDALSKTADRKKAMVDDEVTYTLNFKNTIGTKVDNKCKSTDSLVALGSGSLPAVGASGLKLSTNGSTAYFFAPEYSYGKNGTVYATFAECAQSTQELYIVFRYVSGTPGSADFKGICMKLFINKDGQNNFGYQLYNDGTLVAKEGETWADALQFPGSSTTPTFKFVLNDDHLYMYINDEEDEWSNVVKDWKGLTSAGPGYFGMYVNSNGNSSTQLGEFITELDYAFNITLYDDLPEELGEVTEISDKGVWDEKTNRITWPTIATTKETALAANEEVEYTFKAKVVSCEKYINNTALATVYGQDTLKYIKTIECGEENCKLEEVTLEADDVVACDSTILRATALQKGSYYYEFYLDGEKQTPKNYKYDTLIIKNSGKWHVKVINMTDETCYLESKKITVTVNESPVGDDYDLDIICKNVKVAENKNYAKLATALDAEVEAGNSITWLDEAKEPMTEMPDIDALSAGAYDYMYLIESPTCVSDTYHVTFTIADTVALELKDLTLCSGITGTLDAGEGTGLTYLWSNGEKTQTIEVKKAGEYTVEVTNADGCVSKATSTVKVQDKLEVDLGGDTVICSADLPYILDATENFDTYEWDDASTESKMEVTATGTYSVKVTQGKCEGSGEVKVTVSENPDPKGTFTVTYLIGDTTAAGIFDKTLTEYDPEVLTKEEGITYIWFDADKKKLSDEPTPDVPKTGVITEYQYYVLAMNESGCTSDTIPVLVVVSGTPVPTVEHVSYCQGETATALTATLGEYEDKTITFELQWYDPDKKALTEAPVPSTDEAGLFTYYVTQKGSDGGESMYVPLKVKVYGVATPDTTGNRYDYCAGDTHDALVALSGADTKNYLMGDSIIWTVGSEAWDGKSEIEWATGETKVSVMAAYTIAEGHVCESKKVDFAINVTDLKVPAGDLVVNYVKSEGKTDGFNDLLTKNPTAATPDEGNTLVWYDAEGNKLDGVPTPEYDATWPEGEDVSLTYYVAQTDGKCTSEKVMVEVNISDSPIPTVSPVAYCQGATATALTAIINETVESADNYKLLWYTSETGEGSETAPTPTTDEVGEQTYYVAQQHVTSGAISTKATIKVTIHALPELATTEIAAQCGGEVNLSKYVSEKNGLTVIYEYFDSETSTSALTSSTVDKTGTYYAGAYYEINTTTTETAKCESKALVSLNVDIHDLSDLEITGDEKVCPGATANLVATATSVNPGSITYAWNGGAATAENKYETPAITGKAGEKKTFTVEASAGACSGAKALKKTWNVEITKGVLNGAITVQGEETDRYKTCGGEQLTLNATHEGTDLKWTTTKGESVGTTASIDVNPTTTTQYVVTLTNVCEVSDTVTVEVKPITVKADWKDLSKTICEGNKFSATLTATGYSAGDAGAYIKWYKDGKELTAQAGKLTLSVAKATATDAGTYTYKISNGVCELPEEEDAGTLEVVTNPTFTVTENAVSCSGDAVDIAVTLNQTDAEVAWADGESGPTRTVTPTATTTYGFTATRGGVCSVDGSISVSVKSKPEVTIEDGKVCEGENLTLKPQASGDDIRSYKWTNESGETLGTSANLLVKPSATTAYTVEVESESCGSAKATATVEVVPTPELQIDSVALRSREVEVLNPTSAAYTYRVDKGEWQEDALFEQLTYALHTAYAKDATGCEGSVMFSITAPAISIPEFFTPQGDGVNDTWDVVNILDSYPNATVTIYDRFGKKVAELNGSTSEWDGTYNGTPLPSTDYWYTVNIPEIDKVYNGHFTLLRSK